MINAENEMDFHVEKESVFLLYKLSDSILLMYKAGIVEEYEHPVLMCA